MKLRDAAANAGLAIGSILFFVLVVEVGLRLSGFSYVLYPEEIEFGKPDPVLMKTGFVEDDDLFWVTRDYQEKLKGYLREPPSLVFMGDSCTQFGKYDQRLAERVAARGGTLRYGNLGVAGWTSYQGRRQMERDTVRIRPRAATIYYGWNDHWIGFGIEDKNVAVVKRVFSSRFSEVRLVQLFTKATVAVGTRRTAYPNRVSTEDFGDNLQAIVRAARGAGIEPVLLTAPTSVQAGAEPEYLGSRWLRELSELLPLHNAYVDMVREVGAAENATVCDLAAAFAELPREEVEAAFMADGIHLTDAGDEKIAAFLDKCFEEAGLWPRIMDPQGADP